MRMLKLVYNKGGGLRRGREGLIKGHEIDMILYEAIFKEFHKKKVKYVLVGGLAVNLLGSLRSTADMDIFVEMSDENLAKVVSILKKQGYRVKQPVDPMKLADKDIRNDWIHGKHMKAFNFYQDGGLNEVDIIIDSPVSFEEAAKGVVPIRMGGVTIPVISIDDLIKMKCGTKRDIDKWDVAQLKKIKKLNKKGVS